MVTGRVPWTSPTAAELQKRILSEPLAFPTRPTLSKPLKKLLSRMLDKDPVTRATMQEIKDHEWITCGGKDLLPSEQENCRLVEVTDEDLARVVTSIPNISTLILIKTMLKKHSFQNPFLRSRESSSRRESSETGETAVAVRGKRTVLARAGRSLSAPGNYLTDKQVSFDINLEAVEETKEKPETKQSVSKSSTKSKESKENGQGIAPQR
ncbi:calcium/calmodulin-dependent protein kinase kinase 2-like [Pieris napi]|uniref:calcium/calmodulin-dependent protein kinase kinase 2-like n=1 Tax=Pieris napi TaxID=78633 RepID=UPI001FB95C0B|nr:calcium/calmodulin-dependent protein kinase kinase 2-like [Pieris napi]